MEQRDIACVPGEAGEDPLSGEDGGAATHGGDAGGANDGDASSGNASNGGDSGGGASGGDSGGGNGGVDAGPGNVGGDPPDAGEAPFDPAAPKCASLDPTVVACYDFEDTLSDATQNRNDASGNVTYEQGVSGRAVRVDGQTVRVADDPSLNVSAFTIEIWFRADTLSNLLDDGNVSILLDKDQQYIASFRPNGELRVEVYRGMDDNASTTSTDLPVEADEWIYAAFAYDGSRSFIYRDGELIDTELVGLILSSGYGGTMHIGSGSPATTRPFNGLIDAMRISNVSLSPERICEEAGRTFSAGLCL